MALLSRGRDCGCGCHSELIIIVIITRGAEQRSHSHSHSFVSRPVATRVPVAAALRRVIAPHAPIRVPMRIQTGNGMRTQISASRSATHPRRYPSISTSMWILDFGWERRGLPALSTDGKHRAAPLDCEVVGFRGRARAQGPAIIREGYHGQ